MESTKSLNKLMHKYSDIEEFKFFKFTFKNKVQDRIKDLTSFEMQSIERSQSFKRSNNCSFWEAYIRSGENTSSRLFEHAIFHNKNKDYILVNAKEVERYLFESKDRDLALNSKVRMKSGEELHIAMLDFELPFSSENIVIVKDVLKKLNLKGDIFNSGKSFHFIGDELIVEDELIDLMARFSLLYPIADRAWCSHQIIERSASLRVTMKHGIYPTFLGHVD